MGWLGELFVHIVHGMAVDEVRESRGENVSQSAFRLSHYECEYKDSGLVKRVDMGEIALRCKPGTDKAVTEEKNVTVTEGNVTDNNADKIADKKDTPSGE